jgi:hypothetical protein
MTYFTAERRELIANMKTAIKARSVKDGGLHHEHFVLYAALRGQDIRKTSHQPEGENAREVLEDLDRLARREGPTGSAKIQWFEWGMLGMMRSADGKYLLADEHKVLLQDAFDEARVMMSGEPLAQTA